MMILQVNGTVEQARTVARVQARWRRRRRRGGTRASLR